MKTCKNCQSKNLVPRGKRYFRNQCHACWAQTQRMYWSINRESRLVASRLKYTKHADKRRAESASHKQANREYYALAEWFRKKGIPISGIDPSDINALIEMKKAINQSKRSSRITKQGRETSLQLPLIAPSS